LIPKFPSHLLLGDVVSDLQKWMKQISISFEWRLDYLEIKPAHLHWTVAVPPVTSTARLTQTYRLHTSLNILENYPRFTRENLSNDFWAPGYLIFFGSQPHPVEVIHRFIKQTRRQQGFPVDG
jgi:REP element-mobilizing transposase RayT